jgi:predicted phosphatase
MRKKKRNDPVPETFPSYEAAADFWDTHDTTDYPESFRTVKVVSKLRNRYYEIPLAPDVIRALEKRARETGVTLGRLTSHLLRQRLSR